MPSVRTILITLLILFGILQTGIYSFSQSSFPYSDWIKKLSDQDGPANSGVDEILSVLIKKDSTQANTALNELERKGSKAGNYFIPRFNLLKASWLYNRKGCYVSGRISEFMKKALNGAYDTNDDSLISNISWYYGQAMHGCKAIEPAAMYCLYAIELAERVGIKSDAGRLTMLGSILYSTRDFEKAIYYTRQAIERDPDTSTSREKGEVMSRWNTVALCWQKIGNYDSAFYYYKIALQLARELNSKVWIGIISGNMGQVYYLQGNYKLAKPLLEFDYQESKNDEVASAANSLQWAARINLALGKKDSALMQVEQALRHTQIFYEPIYLRNVSYAAVEVYRAFGRDDSVIKYLGIYNHLQDSIERAVANSSLEIARIKLENLQSAITIKNLHKEKEEEKLIRNFILAAIVMMATIVILVLNRQKQKLVHQRQLVMQQKAAAETEMTSAKEQLEMFKQNIIEKTNLIEKLEHQIQDRETGAVQQQVIDELTHHTILTEQDWEKFKSLFEKIYTGFFLKLKQKAPDITLAEQRMAALTRLHLTSRQMASMLGISPESVQKSNRRLRLRLQLSDEVNLEESIEHL
jgi:tetratricopeptide (TPR) repeat protein